MTLPSFHSVVRHVHVPLTNGLALDTTEVGRLLLGVVLDDVDDGEAIDGEQARVGAIPDGTSSRRRGVNVHAHTEFLRALAREDVDDLGLRDLGCTLEYRLSALVLGSDLDDHVAVGHPGVLERDGAVVAGEDHASERDVVPACM